MKGTIFLTTWVTGDVFRRHYSLHMSLCYLTVCIVELIREVARQFDFFITRYSSLHVQVVSINSIVKQN